MPPARTVARLALDYLLADVGTKLVSLTAEECALDARDGVIPDVSGVSPRAVLFQQAGPSGETPW